MYTHIEDKLGYHIITKSKKHPKESGREIALLLKDLRLAGCSTKYIKGNIYIAKKDGEEMVNKWAHTMKEKEPTIDLFQGDQY